MDGGMFFAGLFAAVCILWWISFRISRSANGRGMTLGFVALGLWILNLIGALVFDFRHYIGDHFFLGLRCGPFGFNSWQPSPSVTHNPTLRKRSQVLVSRVTRHVDSPFRLPRSAPRAGPVFRFQTRKTKTTPQTRTYNPVPGLT